MPVPADPRPPLDSNYVDPLVPDNDIPLDVKRELLACATAKQISYGWLCDVYRKGRAARPAPAGARLRALVEQMRAYAKRELAKADAQKDFEQACLSTGFAEATDHWAGELAAALREAAPLEHGPLEHVNRFEVIDHTGRGGGGRVYSHRPCSVELSLQDGGQTLKVFVSARHEEER